MSTPQRDGPPVMTDTPVAAGSDLDRRLASGLTWSLLNNVLSRVGSLAAGIVLARILVPADYGLFAVALVVLNALLSINELGVSLAIVRWPGSLERIAPTVATMSMVCSAVLYVACFAAAPAVAGALHASDATALIRVLSLCVLADGAAAVSAGLITRAFDQRVRAVIDLGSLVAGSGLSVALALLGVGVWAMVWGLVAANVLASGVTIAAAPRWYAPGWDAAAARTLLAFGTPLAGSSLLLFAMLNVDYIVVGRVLGSTALGVYLLAFNLSAWPATVVSASVRRVSLAAFSRLAEQPSHLGAAFARASGLLLAVALPVAVLLAAYAHPLIALVYGATWSPAAGPLRLLCILAVVRVFAELAYDYLVAIGRTGPNLWLQVLWTACLLPALVIGARTHGITGVALAHAVVALFVVLPAHLLTVRRQGVGLGLVRAAATRPVVGSALVLVSAVGVLYTVPGTLVPLAVGGVVAVVLYVLVVRSMRTMLRTDDLLLPGGGGT